MKTRIIINSILNTTAMIIVSSLVSATSCFIVAFIQGVLIFQDVRFAFINTSLVIAFGFVLGPLLYFALLKNILTVKVFSSLLVIYFGIGFVIILVSHIFGRIGMWAMHLTPMILLFLSGIFYSVIDPKIKKS